MFKNQKGIGLIEAIIAAALVVVAALTISYFVTNQAAISVKIGKSSSCSEISKTISNYISKDGDSLFINSVGIDSDGTFADYANNLTNIDGNLRYQFGGSLNNPQVAQVTAAGGVISQSSLSPVSLGSENVLMRNYLNINNAVSRLVSLASQVNVCQAWGTVFDNTANISLLDGVIVDAGLPLRVEMRLDFLEGSASICSNGALSRLPTSSRSLIVRYEVRITLYPQDPQPVTCESSSSVNISSDVASPAVVVQFDGLQLDARCATTTQANSYCVMGARRQTSDIVARVATVQNRSGCETCIRAIDNKYRTCTPNLVNTDLIASCVDSGTPACPVSDPGSVFFCRLYDRENPNNNWWPCHAKPNTVPGLAQITYQDVSGDLTTTQQGTRATIRIGGLPSARDWILDVRAVDSYGQLLGRSFLDLANEADLVPSAIPPTPPTDPRFRDCSCDGSCRWELGPLITSCAVATAGMPNPVCPVGVPNGTLVEVNVYEENEVICTYPGFPTDPIWEANCVATDKISGQGAQCSLPCVGAPPPPTYSCTSSNPSFGPCIAGSQTRTYECRDNLGNTVAANLCNSPPSCQDTVPCGGPPPNYACSDWTEWTDCTPDCMNQSCEETRTGTCYDDLGNTVASGFCPDSCVETRTDTVTGCAFTCDTSTATASACSTGPCDQPGEITYTGAVCRDSTNAIVDVSNCGGNCNPPPESCDRGCASSCVPSSGWSPDPCSTPCGAAIPNQRVRTTTCQFSDETACGQTCSDETEVCPPEACANCGALAHGESQTVNTYTTAAPACGDTCQATPVQQSCNNGVLSPDLSGAITSCTNPVIGTPVCAGPPFCPRGTVCEIQNCFIPGSCNPAGSCCTDLCPYYYCEHETLGCHLTQCP